MFINMKGELKMIITRKEVTEYIQREIGKKDSKIADDILDATVKLWFSNSSIVEVEFTAFCKWVLNVLDYAMTKVYIECPVCGYKSLESNFRQIKEKRRTENKKVYWNEQKQDYELDNREYELEFYICPGCKKKLLKSSTPL